MLCHQATSLAPLFLNLSYSCLLSLFALVPSLSLANLVCLCLTLTSVALPAPRPLASHCLGEHSPQWSCVLQLLLRQASKFLPARFLAAGEPSERQMLLGGNSIPRDSYMRKLPKVGPV